MLYRQLINYNVSSLCFGTATFVSGKLCPELNSQPGLLALHHALKMGINLVHSNPNLETQWAIGQTLKDGSFCDWIGQLIKIETPLEMKFDLMKNFFMNRVQRTCKYLPRNKIIGIIHEIDLKRTIDKSLLINDKFIENYFKEAKFAYESLRDIYPDIRLFLGMMHNLEHLSIALDSQYDGIACYYNILDNWPFRYLDQVEKKGKVFLGIRPLKHKALTEKGIDLLKKSEFNYVKAVQANYFGNEPIQKIAIRFALAHPAVKSLIVGMTTAKQVDELVDATKKPISLDLASEIISMQKSFLKKD